MTSEKTAWSKIGRIALLPFMPGAWIGNRIALQRHMSSFSVRVFEENGSNDPDSMRPITIKLRPTQYVKFRDEQDFLTFLAHKIYGRNAQIEVTNKVGEFLKRVRISKRQNDEYTDGFLEIVLHDYDKDKPSGIKDVMKLAQCARDITSGFTEEAANANFFIFGCIMLCVSMILLGKEYRTILLQETLPVILIGAPLALVVMFYLALRQDLKGSIPFLVALFLLLVSVKFFG